MFGKVSEDSLQTLFPALGNISKSNSEISESSEFSLRSSKLTSNGLTRLDFSLNNLREEFLSSSPNHSELHNNKKNNGISAISPPGFNVNSDFSSLLNSLDKHNKSNNINDVIPTSPLSPSPDTDTTLSPLQQQQQLAKTNTSRYKTELCRPYQENGTCKYGEKCQFAHGRQELRSVSRHPKYKTDLCRTYHSVGFCPYGPRCHFVHNLDEGKPNQKENNGQTNGSQGGQASPSAPGQPLGNGMPPLPMFSTRGYSNSLSDSVSNSPSSSSSSSSNSDFESENGEAFSPFMSPSRLPVFSTISK